MAFSFDGNNQGQFSPVGSSFGDPYGYGALGATGNGPMTIAQPSPIGSPPSSNPVTTIPIGVNSSGAPVFGPNPYTNNGKDPSQLPALPLPSGMNWGGLYGGRPAAPSATPLPGNSVMAMHHGQQNLNFRSPMTLKPQTQDIGGPAYLAPINVQAGAGQPTVQLASGHQAQVGTVFSAGGYNYVVRSDGSILNTSTGNVTSPATNGMTQAQLSAQYVNGVQNHAAAAPIGSTIGNGANAAGLNYGGTPAANYGGGFNGTGGTGSLAG